MLDASVTDDGHAWPDLVCFSHLRWDFVYQRVQHLIGRAARQYRVTFWEEPLYTEEPGHRLVTRVSPEGVTVVQPFVSWGADRVAAQREMLDELIVARGIVDPVLWYYTPMALAFSGHLAGQPVVYDCMDELSAFAGADPDLPHRERALMQRAALVFTGGLSLFESKRAQHPAVYAFPSGVDLAHFMPARHGLVEPADQVAIGLPRIGFFGVLDERLDRSLLATAAAMRPDWHFVAIGPLAKLDASDLPSGANLHFLGPKDYEELPAYIAHWDVAMLPFALNDATRFISPTKMPEYLAAGCPVVSTPIADVARNWGESGCVRIAADAASFMAAADALRALPPGWTSGMDGRLAEMSWDGIWARMALLIDAVREGQIATIERKPRPPTLPV
jgi:UDP-galactopyranose mutase